MFLAVTINPLLQPQGAMGVGGFGLGAAAMGPVEPTLNLKLSSFAEMSTEQFARRATGSDNLSEVEKKQIREQQQVLTAVMTPVITNQTMDVMFMCSI